MCEQTPFSYQSGQVVWVKLGSCWWPGEARAYDELPEDAKTSFKKVPVAVVQFFQEEKYEYVRNYDQVCLYNCRRKNEFIQKGLEMLRKHKNEQFMNKFPSDVIRAEELTNGDPNIIKKFQSMPDERPDYNVIFGKNGKSPRKGRSPSKFKRRSLPARRKIDLNVLVPDNRILFGRRSVDSVLSKPEEDHKLFIRVQPCPDKDYISTTNVLPTEQTYSCFLCDFKTKRLEGFMAHRKSHLSSTYGAPRPQTTTPKRSRKKTDSASSKKRTSYPPSATSRSRANKKSLSYTSKSPNTKTEVAQLELSKPDDSEPVKTSKASHKKKVVAKEPEIPETKSLIKSPISQKKAPRKRKNEDVIKTQLLADWDDEDPTLLQQEEERIKKKCKASCFDFDDSADSILDTELEERANKFARTRNIPIIPKPESGSKRQRLDDLPSTSKNTQSSKKRPFEETFRRNKRSKSNVVDPNEEEAYTKLMLGDAVPEYEPLLESLAMPCSDNNNTLVEGGQEEVKLNGLEASREADVTVLELSDECNSRESIVHVNEQDSSEVVFCNEQELIGGQVEESAELINDDGDIEEKDQGLPGELQDNSTEPSPKQQTGSSELEMARHCPLPDVVADVAPVEVDSSEAPGSKEDCGPEHADMANSADVTESVAIVSCDGEAENIEHSSQSEIKKDDDEDDDMPELICVERRASRKTVFFSGEYGEGSDQGESVSSATTPEIEEQVAKQSDEVEARAPGPNEASSHEEAQPPMSVLASNEIDASSSKELCGPSMQVCVDEVEAGLLRTYNNVTHVNEETGENVLEGENSEEITIIGFKSGTIKDLKEMDENMREKSTTSSLGLSQEGSAAGDVPESAEVAASDTRHITEFSDSDNALIKILDGSADDDKLDGEEIHVVEGSLPANEEESLSNKEEDPYSSKVGDISKVEVSRDEIVAEWSDEFEEDNHAAPTRERAIEVIDLDKSESESNDGAEKEEDTAADPEDTSTEETIMEMEEGRDAVMSKTVLATDAGKYEDMELDINSMPVVVEDAVIKDDNGASYGCVPPSTSHISVVGTSASASLPPATLLLSSATTPVKTLANNIVIVSSQSCQLPLTAKGIFTTPHSKVVIMPRAARGRKLAPVLVANSSGLTTRMCTESEQESFFKEGRKTLLQRVRPKITLQPSKTKPLLPNIQKSITGAEAAGVKIIQSKSVVLPGTSLIHASSSGVTRALKVDPTGLQSVAVQGTLPKILVGSGGTQTFLLQKSIPKLTSLSSNTNPQGSKRVTNFFPLVKGSGINSKQVVISQPSRKPPKGQAAGSSMQLVAASHLQPPKKARQAFSYQGSKAVPTTTIEISVCGAQPVVAPASAVQRSTSASSIPRIPSSAILPGAPASTTPIVVGAQGSPSFVLIVDPGDAQPCRAAPGQDILAAALANTEVFTPEACLRDTLAVASSTQAVLPAVPPAGPPLVLETPALTEPIMTPQEVPSRVHAVQCPSMPLLTDQER
ncbi:uncharacterized protein LOC134527555 [Bacillus rossius redtenbacheri]|uniref:uncharacterized protein LOC134527555 n=1 Tax=Bacillus rossius redtenbacheri TaxID=93214 RepID=UPI002FDCCD00